MGEQQPIQLSDHTCPPFRPNSPDPEHEARTVLPKSMVRAECAAQQLFFGNARVQRYAVEERVHRSQKLDAAAKKPICHSDTSIIEPDMKVNDTKSLSGGAKMVAEVDQGLRTRPDSIDQQKKNTTIWKYQEIGLWVVMEEGIDDSMVES